MSRTRETARSSRGSIVAHSFFDAGMALAAVRIVVLWCAQPVNAAMAIPDASFAANVDVGRERERNKDMLTSEVGKAGVYSIVGLADV